MDRQEREYRRVLDYLRDMIEFCQRAHRDDLERDYREAWETAASNIYGQLPPRPGIKVFYAPQTPRRRQTRWRAEMLAKPYRKVSRRFGDHLMLECGHLIWSPAHDDDPPAKRRRCPECAKQVRGKLPVGNEVLPAARQQAAIAGRLTPSRVNSNQKG